MYHCKFCYSFATGLGSLFFHHWFCFSFSFKLTWDKFTWLSIFFLYWRMFWILKCMPQIKAVLPSCFFFIVLTKLYTAYWVSLLKLTGQFLLFICSVTIMPTISTKISRERNFRGKLFVSKKLDQIIMTRFQEYKTRGCKVCICQEYWFTWCKAIFIEHSHYQWFVKVICFLLYSKLTLQAYKEK